MTIILEVKHTALWELNHSKYGKNVSGSNFSFIYIVLFFFHTFDLLPRITKIFYSKIFILGGFFSSFFVFSLLCRLCKCPLLFPCVRFAFQNIFHLSKAFISNDKLWKLYMVNPSHWSRWWCPLITSIFRHKWRGLAICLFPWVDTIESPWTKMDLTIH